MINLRKAEERDRDFLREIRNQISVVISCEQNTPVNSTQHAEWFKKSLEREDRVIYIILDETRKIGYLRFDTDDNWTTSTISVAIGEHDQHKGFGKEAISLGSMTIFLEKRSLESIMAKIRIENASSTRAFMSCNYEPFELDKEFRKMILKKEKCFE